MLKPIPLRTPTTIQLRPGLSIRVTLFDANHCVGAVSFLIEGNGKAILYTGDIRAEPWWVNALVREPAIVPYASRLERLDCIYLDTTVASAFTAEKEVYREFPTQASGIEELLRKVGKYPKDIVFFVEAWTFGYENVWIALSNFLGSKVHLDRYRYSIYTSLAKANNALGCQEAPALAGFMLGNHRMEGCLTQDPNVRIHSCEQGFKCPVIREFRNTEMVRIVPIISRTKDGRELHELGIGGGKGDLSQIHELEIQDERALRLLKELCEKKIMDEDLLTKLHQMLSEGKSLELELKGKKEDLEGMKLDELLKILIEQAQNGARTAGNRNLKKSGPTGLPREITFPYSRHSSYSELCGLAEALNPRDIYPCTVIEESWEPSVSMKALFGRFCSADIFAHDAEIMSLYQERKAREEATLDSQRTESERETQSSEVNLETERYFTPPGGAEPVVAQAADTAFAGDSLWSLTSSDFCHCQTQHGEKPQHAEDSQQLRAKRPRAEAEPSQEQQQSASQSLPKPRTHDRSIRQWAYLAAAGLDEDCDSWDAFGGLACVKQTEPEIEL